MTELALALGALLAVAAVVYLARPLLRCETASDNSSQEELAAGAERLALLEERDRVLAALRELEFDHRTGKVSDEDYRALVPELRARAAEALRGLDRGTPGAMATPAPEPSQPVPRPPL